MMEQTADYIREAMPKQYSRELLDLISVQSYCRIEHLVDAGIAKRLTSSTYLNQLEEVGVLQGRQLGTLKLFLNTRFLKFLTRESNNFGKFGSH